MLQQTSQLKLIPACAAIAAGNILAVIVATGQLPEGAELFDYTNAASSAVLAGYLIGRGVCHLASHVWRSQAQRRGGLEMALAQVTAERNELARRLHAAKADNVVEFGGRDREGA